MFHNAHTEEGECDLSAPKILKTYKELCVKKEMTWMLLSYTRTNGCALDVFGSGNDHDNLLTYMKDDAVHFAIVKVAAGNSTYGTVEKFILVVWVGRRVAPQKRSKASRHKKTVASIIPEGPALEVHTSDVDDVKESSLLQKLYTARSNSRVVTAPAIRQPQPTSNPTTTTTNPTRPPPKPPVNVAMKTSDPTKPKPPTPTRPLPASPRSNGDAKEKEDEERLEKEKAEKERLEKERLEQERLETERLEQEKERSERERLDKEKQQVPTSPKQPSTGFRALQDKFGNGTATNNNTTPKHSPQKGGLTVPGGNNESIAREMGRLGKKVGVSPHPVRRPSPPATPGPPHHTTKPPPKELRFGLGHLQGKRPTMEDRHVALKTMPKNPKLAFFGVYDGHQGEEAAEFVAENLHDEVDKYLAQAESKYGGDRHKALVQAFITVDENFCDEACNNYWDSGTTVIAAIFDSESKKVLAVNLGDSRCVLGRGGKPVALSEDHKPWVETEKERILASGKTIEDNRINGSHSFTRSIGDREMKDDLLEPHEQAISPIPEFREEELSKDLTQREFLILACDGLWDVMSNAEAVAWVEQKLETEDDLDSLALQLAQHAIDIGSTDNVSVLIVLLPK